MNTDGEFSWPESLTHYIEQHSVRLPVALGLGGPTLSDIGGIAGDLFKPDARWWRERTKPLVAFGESVALWSSRQSGIDEVVSAAIELLDREMAGPATAVLAGATRIETSGDLCESVRRACQELGIRFDQPESALAFESTNRVRFARALRNDLSGWDLLNELSFVVDTTQNGDHEGLRTLLSKLEISLFVESDGGIAVGGELDRTQIETELKNLAYRNLAVSPSGR